MENRVTVTRAVLYDAPVSGPMRALTESRPLGLLPFANRPLVHHLISQLAQMGIREVDVFTAEHHEEMAAYLSAGERWGVKVRSYRQERAPEKGLPRELAEHIAPYGLFMRLDCWPGRFAMQAFLTGSNRKYRQLLGGGGALQCFCGDVDAISDAGREWPMVYCYTAFQLNSPGSYLRANLECLGQLDAGHALEQPYGDRLFLGTACRVSESARFEGAGLLGAGSRVEKGVRFGADVIAGEHVFLDRDCDIERSVILDGTYVGRGVRLRNMIIDGSRIIDCRTGEVSCADSPALLARPIRRTSERKLARGLFRWLTAGAAA